jgi:hypothetical protein
MKKIVVIIVICLLCLGIAVGVSCLTSHEFTDVTTTVRTHMYPAQLKTKIKFRFGPTFCLNDVSKITQNQPFPSLTFHYAGLIICRNSYSPPLVCCMKTLSGVNPSCSYTRIAR